MEPAASHRTAADALSRGDPLRPLNAIDTDRGPHASARRAIAPAQLHELPAAQRELRAAAETFRAGGDEARELRI